MVNDDAENEAGREDPGSDADSGLGGLESPDHPRVVRQDELEQGTVVVHVF